jgi:hypothetical protein
LPLEQTMLNKWNITKWRPHPGCFVVLKELRRKTPPA